MKKRVLLITALIFMLSFTMVFADARASGQLSSYSIIVGSSGTTFIADVDVKGTHSNLTRIGTSSITIYEKNTSGTWVAVKTFGQNYGLNTGAHMVTVTYAGTKGKEYCATANVYGEDTTGYTSRSISSSSRTL